MRITQVKETCLYISDLNKAEEFYHGLLGFPLISKVKDRHIFFRSGSSVLLCFLPEITKTESHLPQHYAEGKQHIAFEVEQAEYLKAKEEILKCQIKITHEQEWRDGLESFYFEDPFGHVLEIVPKGIWEKD